MFLRREQTCCLSCVLGLCQKCQWNQHLLLERQIPWRVEPVKIDGKTFCCVQHTKVMLKNSPNTIYIEIKFYSEQVDFWKLIFLRLDRRKALRTIEFLLISQEVFVLNNKRTTDEKKVNEYTELQLPWEQAMPFTYD